MDDEFDQLPVQECLTSLKLDLELRGRRAEHQVQRAKRRLAGHIELDAVAADPGHLAVGA